MYCKNCGKEINDNAVICVNCGVAVKPLTPAVAPAVEQKAEVEKKVNVCSIIGLVLSIVGGIVGMFGIFLFDNFLLSNLMFYTITLAGLILSIIGTTRSSKLNSGMGIGIGGIVTSAVLLLIGLPCTFIGLIILRAGGYY